MSTESSAARCDQPSTVDVDGITAAATSHSGWLADVLRQLDAIKKLPRGWDSHGGNPVDTDVVAAAEKVVKHLACFSEVSRPTISPTTAGGVQFEWEGTATYFEVHFETPTQARCYFESQPPPSEEEFTFHDGDDAGILAEYAARVSSI